MTLLRGLLGLTVSLFPSALVFAGASDPTKVEVLKELARRKYFLHGTCTDIANTFLEKNGLPQIGKKTPISGTRGSFDRAQSQKEPPVLKDEVTNGNVKTSLAAGVPESSSAKTWQLKIVRSRKEGSEFKPALTTVLKFNSAEKNAGGSCDLQEISIKNAKNFEMIEKGPIGCLDFFPNSKAITVDTTTLDWIQNDCALGLHYSHALHEQGLH